MLGNNRIVEAIERMKAQIEGRLETGQTTEAALEELNKTLRLAHDEHFKFQEVKTWAQAMQIINVEEALTLYTALGESPETFNKQPLAIKAIVTKTLAELLQAKITAGA